MLIVAITWKMNNYFFLFLCALCSHLFSKLFLMSILGFKSHTSQLFKRRYTEGKACSWRGWVFNGGRLRMEERVAVTCHHFPKPGGESDISLQNWAVRKDPADQCSGEGTPAVGIGLLNRSTHVTALCSGLSRGSLGNSPGGSHSGPCGLFSGSQPWGCRGVSCWRERPIPIYVLLQTDWWHQGGPVPSPPKVYLHFTKLVSFWWQPFYWGHFPKTVGKVGEEESSSSLIQLILLFKKWELFTKKQSTK